MMKTRSRVLPAILLAICTLAPLQDIVRAQVIKEPPDDLHALISPDSGSSQAAGSKSSQASPGLRPQPVRVSTSAAVKPRQKRLAEGFTLTFWLRIAWALHGYN